MISESDNRYAQALFSLALDEKKVAEYQRALGEVSAFFQVHPDVYGVLSSYAVPQSGRSSLIDALWGKNPLKSLDPFLKVLSDHHQIERFDAIVAAFDGAANDYRGVKSGLVYSSEPLAKETIARLEQSLGERVHAEVHLENRVDSHLLGGVKVALDGKVYDGSLAARLEKLRAQLLKQGGSL